MEIIAIAKHIQQSPKKIRVVANEVAQLSPVEAIEVLKHTKKRAAKPLQKVLQSALANAENNHNLKSDKLAIKEIEVGQARIRKQPEFGARGRLSWRQRRSSHIRIVLEEK